MSEQSKSNFQAFGAGLLGFVAVMAVGGGALMLHSSHQAKSAPKAVPAAEPIDLAAPAQRDPDAPIAPVKERRAESPAPLVGSDDDTEVAESPAAPAASLAGERTADEKAAAAASVADAAASSPEAAPNAKPAATRLQPGAKLDIAEGHSSAVASANAPAAKKSAKNAAAKKPLAKLAPAAAPPASIASVHYGVTTRDELMGRAAGPVYNIKGASSPEKSKPGEGGKLASEMNERLAGLQSQLDGSTALTAEQRAEIQKELADLKKGVSNVGGAQ